MVKDQQLEDVSIVIENSLIEGRFWLPRRQEIEIRRTGSWMDFPARGIIRGRWEIRQYRVNGGSETQVIARSPDPSIDLRTVVGGPAALRLVAVRRSGRFMERRWTGVCSRARAVQAVEVGEGEIGLSTYELTIMPSLWLLQQRSGNRIFQHLAIPEVVQALLDEWGITSRWLVAAEDHPRLPYKVQYAETDLDLVNRLLEEAGISYRFADDGEDEREASSLVLSDAMHAAGLRREAAIRFVDSPTDTLDEDFLTRISVEDEVRVTRIVVRDHDFERPMWRLSGEAQAVPDMHPARERYVYQPGAFLVEKGGGGCGRRVSHADGYGAALHARPWLLWPMRIGLLLAAGLHIAAAVPLARRARQARGPREVRPGLEAATLAAHSMRIGGVLLAGFIVFHVLHLTAGILHPAFIAGGVHHNVVAGLRVPAVAAIYLGAVTVLALHAAHGLFSARRSLGLTNPSKQAPRRLQQHNQTFSSSISSSKGEKNGGNGRMFRM